MSNKAKEPFFQCGSCKRSYNRVDHLVRHVRSHTQSKPYRCEYCPKSYGRIDLLKRHVTRHDPKIQPSSQSVNPVAGPIVPGRVTQACTSCASNHLRCTDKKPCERCEKKGIECVWSRPTDWASSVEDEEEQADQSEEANDSRSWQSEFAPDDTAQSPSKTGNLDNLMEVDALVPNNASTVALLSPPVGGSVQQSIFTMGQTPLSGQTLGDMQHQQHFTAVPSLNLLNWTGSEGLAASVPGAQFDFDDMDFRYLDTYNERVPFEFTRPSTPAGINQQADAPNDCSSSFVPNPDTSPDLFRSLCLFKPTSEDNGSAEEPNLSLPRLIDNAASPESLIAGKQRYTCAVLSVEMRDKILLTVLNSCRRENLIKVVASFPSAELLDLLLQYYLGSPVAKPMMFLHTATFDPNHKRPELIAAMAAAGAVLTSDSTLTKLGLAIQESLRRVIGDMWEAENALTRDLQLLQAYLIGLEIAIWSGYSRKVEIAESFLQPIVTMLRRDARFRTQGYQSIIIDENAKGEELDSIWKHWIHQESLKRVAFRVLQHDNSSSNALLVSPLISYAELTLPLPDTMELWMATTAESWKHGYLRRLSQPTFLLSDYFEDPHGVLSHPDAVDIAVGNFAYLSCIWAIAWDVMQLHLLQGSTPKRWNGVLSASRKEELMKLLNLFRLNLDGRAPNIQETVIRLEIICLHLHMPLEDIQAFAGRACQDKVCPMWPSIRAWASSEPGRRAVWHAGQIFLATKTLPQTMIQGPLAVMLYHATLALWAYGVLSNAPERHEVRGRSGFLHDGDDVWLDAHDDLQLQRFLEYGRGRPCIRSLVDAEGGQQLYLRRPGGVIAAVLDLLQANFAQAMKPVLIDRLMQLMHNLQTCSAAIGTE